MIVCHGGSNSRVPEIEYSSSMGRKMRSMTNNGAMLPPIGLSAVVDVFDDVRLFEELDNDRILQLSRMGGGGGFSSVENIRRSTGVSIRRLLAQGTSGVDLAVALCHRLQEVTQISLHEFSAILLCHSHTDETACSRMAEELCRRMQLPAGSVQPVNYGCSGFLKLLHDGAWILDSSPRGSSVALLSVETPEIWHDAADRLFCGIVSAGATAAVLQHGGGMPLSVIRSDDFDIPAERRINDGPLFRKDTADVVSFHGDSLVRTVMRMNSEPVFLNGIELMLNNLRAAMVSIEREPGQRVVVAPHQPSGKLLRALIAAARIEFPDLEFLNNLDRYGNMISSSVPTLLSRLPEVLQANDLLPLREGDHLILLAAGICMRKIDDHMSGGHACLQWNTAVSLNRPEGSAHSVLAPEVSSEYSSSK